MNYDKIYDSSLNGNEMTVLPLNSLEWEFWNQSGSKIQKNSEIEFQLPKPSYTSQTLRWLVSNDNKGDSGEREYFIIMGMDCLAQIDKWKDYEYIIDNFQILVYKRVGYNFDYSSLPFKFPVKEIDAPIIELSSTMIRERIKNKQSLKYLVPDCLLSSIKNLEYFQ